MMKNVRSECSRAPQPAIAASKAKAAMRRSRWLIGAKSSLIVLFAALLTLCACAPGHDIPLMAQYDPGTYTLGPDDVIHIVTYGETQLSLDYRISAEGTIDVPLIGKVHAAGLTQSELGTQVASLLEAKGLIKGASVSVQLTTYRNVSILGEVLKPGQYPYQPGMTMLSLVAAGGGFTYRAVEQYGYVLRQYPGETTARIGRIDAQDYVKPGDIVKVYERLF